MRIKVSYSSIIMVLLSLAGAGALSACGYGHADEPYIATRCNESGDHCWQVRCNGDGTDCYPVGTYNRNDESYDRSYNRNGGAEDRPYRVCDDDGENCHWVHRDSQGYSR